MITQETYEALKDARKKLKNRKGDTNKMLFEGQAQDLYDLLDTTIREFDGENEMTNVPDRVFLVIGEDTPDGADFDEFDEVWLVTRGDGTQRIEVLYECYDKIEWFDFDELK